LIGASGIYKKVAGEDRAGIYRVGRQVRASCARPP
jgi:hypothetical protein